MEPSRAPTSTSAPTTPPRRAQALAVPFLVCSVAWVLVCAAMVGWWATDARLAIWLPPLLALVPIVGGAWLLHLRDAGAAPAADETGAAETRQLHAMARHLLSLQENERRAISRELHDDIGQAITAIKLSAHAALDESDPARRAADLRSIAALADDTIGKLRDISTLLRPPQLDALGLEAALRWQAGMLFRSAGAALEMDIATLAKRPADEDALICFRIAQEGLTNALRHAGARRIRLSLQETRSGALCLRVEDDGCGFEPRREGPGLGLVLMRERAQSAGGFLRIDSAPGNGCRLLLYLPCSLSSAAPPPAA